MFLGTQETVPVVHGCRPRPVHRISNDVDLRKVVSLFKCGAGRFGAARGALGMVRCQAAGAGFCGAFWLVQLVEAGGREIRHAAKSPEARGLVLSRAVASRVGGQRHGRNCRWGGRGWGEKRDSSQHLPCHSPCGYATLQRASSPPARPAKRQRQHTKLISRRSTFRRAVCRLTEEVERDDSHCTPHCTSPVP